MGGAAGSGAGWLAAIFIISSRTASLILATAGMASGNCWARDRAVWVISSACLTACPITGEGDAGAGDAPRELGAESGAPEPDGGWLPGGPNGGVGAVAIWDYLPSLRGAAFPATTGFWSDFRLNPPFLDDLAISGLREGGVGFVRKIRKPPSFGGDWRMNSWGVHRRGIEARRLIRRKATRKLPSRTYSLAAGILAWVVKREGGFISARQWKACRR